MKKENMNQKIIPQRTVQTNHLLLLASVLALFILIAGCSSPSTPHETAPSTPSASASSPSSAPNASSVSNTPSPSSQACTNKDCFVLAANNCQDVNFTSSEDIGVLEYTANRSCVFTKTIVSLGANETDEMKNLLQGKGMTCYYQKGKFDPRLVNTLIIGSENCDGELKDILAELVAAQ